MRFRISCRAFSRTSFAVSAIALLALAACGAGQKPSPAAAAGAVQRGAYLVNLGGCNDCHSPKVFTESGPVPDSKQLLSGSPGSAPLPKMPAGVIGRDQWGALTTNDLTAWAGPWGVSFGVNLTPDATGLKAWTADTFIQAMRTGKHMGTGRPILPPMPWPSLAKLPDEDLRAIFAYLQSLPPVANIVPAPIPPAGAAAGT